MAANYNPIYARTADIQIGGALIGPSAQLAFDGTGSNMFSIFQADPTEGSYVQKVIFKPTANGTVNLVATVIRVYYHNQSTFVAGTTNGYTNTALIGELSTAAWTTSATLASPQYEIPINMPMNPGTRLLVSFGTSTSANSGFNPVTIAGKY